MAAVLGVLGLAAAGIFATQSPRPKHRKIVAAETPSWTLQADPGESAETTSSPVHHSHARTQSAVSAGEVITPQQLRVANTTPCAARPAHIVSIRDYGARGDGVTDDSDAIQRANDAVAPGGGRVVFPAGIYRTYNVQQNSCVEFRGERGATLIHPDGTSPEAVIRGRITRTKGSIALGSRVLAVQSTAGIRRGALVAIRAAGGRSRIQQTYLAAAAPPLVNSISVRTTKGFDRQKIGYLLLGNEIISYRGVWQNRLTNLKRGLFGTEEVHHRAGSVVAQAQRMYAVVAGVSGNQVVLDGVSRQAVTNADVDIGSVGMTVTGLTIDGNRRPSGSPGTNPFPLKFSLARWVAVRESTIRNGDHGGVSFDKGTRDSIIERNTLFDQGDPAHRLGSAIWLFAGASKNVVRDNTISGHTFIGVTVDDRSVSSTEYDADSRGNSIIGNTIDIASFGSSLNAGVVISSTGTLVRRNEMRHSTTGIMIAVGEQGPIASPAFFNRVFGNTFDTHKVGIVVSGSDNEFVRNLIRHADQPLDNSGERNRFIDNTIE